MQSRGPRRRLTAVLLGGVAGVGACVLAVFLILGVSDGGGTGGIANSGADSGTGAGPANGERSVVPDACETVGDELAGELAPDADRTQSDSYQASDRQNQCVWGAYTGEKKRVLTVELRAVAGSGGATGADTASRTFQAERDADQSGKSLLDGQELDDKRTVPDLGDEAYAVYWVDSAQNSGEAIVNVRQGNVLITVHYGGSNGDDGLGADPAIDGAVAAAKETAAALASGA
ncbi:hypothetical protein [Thermomonospora umbrina]|uniref:hypothetical protein n=1 Tax=Thermomonospora umbrina TaxID=111806 RepID=UPI0011C0F03B|nr:hypothetical protein [Thermomonospora umbrina]